MLRLRSETTDGAAITVYVCETCMDGVGSTAASLADKKDDYRQRNVHQFLLST